MLAEYNQCENLTKWQTQRLQNWSLVSVITHCTTDLLWQINTKLLRKCCRFQCTVHILGALVITQVYWIYFQSQSAEFFIRILPSRGFGHLAESDPVVLIIAPW